MPRARSPSGGRAGCHRPPTWTDAFFLSGADWGGRLGDALEYLATRWTDGQCEAPHTTYRRVGGARDWPEDAHPQYENGKSRGYDALGHALESATTGSDYGAARPELHRGEDERAVMQRVMERYGSDDKDLMDNQVGNADSMGRMGAAYVDDLNYGLAGYNGDPQSLDADKLLGVKPEHGCDYGISRDFIRELGQDETSHGIMSQAQQAYTTSLVHQHADTTEAYTVAEWGAAAHGALDEARTEQIGKDYRDSDDQYNHEREKATAWKQAGVSVACNRGRDMTDTDNAR
ncbi:hypothetical protein [Streptomyces sp. NPDC056628]|uniref:hypothetical protein n=1 Tax=Streptomyces sp. NPDC056628 TaxID=3345882 RepID=UPI00369F8170